MRKSAHVSRRYDATSRDIQWRPHWLRTSDKADWNGHFAWSQNVGENCFISIAVVNFDFLLIAEGHCCDFCSRVYVYLLIKAFLDSQNHFQSVWFIFGHEVFVTLTCQHENWKTSWHIQGTSRHTTLNQQWFCRFILCHKMSKQRLV